MTLQDFFTQNRRVALGFSGGVDSSYLLWAGRHYGADVRPYYACTPFQPRFEQRDAQQVAAFCGVSLNVLSPDVMDCSEIAANGPDRCYHCKKRLFSAIIRAARTDGYPVVIDGTNASDREDDRPGMAALRELGVLSPLAVCNLRKAEIRRLAERAGLPVWDKPAYACLATRIPIGTPIRSEALRLVEAGEQVLFEMGFSDFRIRLQNGCARIQVRNEDWPKLCADRETLLNRLQGFAGILLDAETRCDRE